MKILLVSPPTESLSYKEGYYPIGLAIIGRILENEGHEVLIKDYYYKKYAPSTEEVLALIRRFKPDVFGMTCMTMNRVSCFRYSKIAKQINPNIKVIMGGVHASIMHEQILKNFPIDAIVIGEGEITTPELIKAFEKNKKLGDIKGIAFKDKKNRVIITGCRSPIENLDLIPFPKHEAFAEVINKTKEAVMITSRGCPFGCTFCSTTRYWGRKWRARSANNVVDEIEMLKKKFPSLKYITFYDDEFTIDKKRIMDLCDEMIKRKLGFEWSCAARVDSVSEEMLKKMKMAGCTNIGYGVESGSQKMLDAMGKKITLAQIKDAINLTNKVGIHYSPFLMVGIPGETWQTVKEGSRFLNSVKNLNAKIVARLEIYPNTPIYELAKKQGIIDDSYWLTEKKVPIYSYEHSPEELTKMAYYLVAKNQLHRGLINFIIFSIRFFLEKPEKVIRYLKIRLKLI